MASGLSFFLSSPPRPTSNTTSLQSPSNLWNRTAFFTPQHHNHHPSSSYSKWAGGSGLFTPTSPSPLRTSRNENLLLMSSPLPSNFLSEGEKEAFRAVGEEENTIAGGNGGSATPTFSFQGLAPTASDTGSAAVAASSAARKFQFSARAAAASSSALLQSHTDKHRDSRRKLFLDRLRNRRDDARHADRYTGDQVLRMEWARERREWEELQQKAAAAEAAAWGLELDGNVDYLLLSEEEEGHNQDMTVMMMEEDEENAEVEDLMNTYYDQLLLQQQQRNQKEQEGKIATNFEEFSDDGYDEAFMEVLSSSHGQNPGQHEQGPQLAQNVDVNMDMDMS